MKLPEPETYEKELLYMPYRDSLRKVAEIIESRSPHDGKLLDLMCGPGYLLKQIVRARPDISLRGVDLDEEYIKYAKEKYPFAQFEVGDVLSWEPKEVFDVVICTGSLHHIPYEKQESVIEKMASMVKSPGFCIISDCYVDDYSNETDRKLAAAKLGYEYLIETIKNDAPEDVIAATLQIKFNDVLGTEFKTSLKKRRPSFLNFFWDVELIKTWPNFDSEYGDYITILNNPRRVK